ncbi:methyl-accepting chemotaxis protein, partial [Duganella callida]
LADLARLHAELGARFRDADAYRGFEQRAQALLALPAGTPPATALRHYNELVGAATHLVVKLSDGSELSLDPAADTYHMINFSLLRGTLLNERLARIQAADALAEPARAAALRAELPSGVGALELLRADMDNAYREAVLAEPALARRLNRDGAWNALDRFIGMARDDTDTDAGAALSRAAQDALRQLQTLQADALLQLHEELEARIGAMRHRLALQLGVSLACVLLAAYFMLCFYRVMMGGLREVGRHLEAITQGNLTVPPVPWGKDEAASLMLTMGAMQDSLRHIARSVHHGSSRIESASGEMAEASHALSHRTEQAAASLEETAASMEQVAQTVNQNAASIESARDIVQHNGVVARDGDAAMTRLLANMDGMQSAARQIVGIISVIDGIAFQTNILALNAAVEAARAGEQGRGFAVVASEVRQLAGRSATAAREIKDLIQACMRQVDEGSGSAAAAGHTMRDIMGGAGRLQALMEDIALATREQRQGIEQIRQAITGLDATTQENAAMVEQSAAAASAMSEHAAGLARTASFFKLA